MQSKKYFFLFMMIFCMLLKSSANENAWILAGNKSFQMQEFDMAIFYYTKALEEKPNFIQAYLERSRTYLMVGEFELSAQDMRRAYEIDPNYVRHYLENKKAYKRISNQQPM